MAVPAIQGTVAPGFEAVASEFARNFSERREIGASFCAYHRGVKVVDLWAGLRHQKRALPWEESTLAVVFSTTKGMSALAMALAHSRGLFDLDQTVARYWPEFGQAGKGRITVRQLLAHEAGLVALDSPLTREILADRQALSDLLARQRPLWEPGTRHGYHAVTLGWYQSELLRRVDQKGRSIGQFFREEIAGPLGAEFYIGLPETVTEERLAHLQWPRTREYFLGGNLSLRGMLSFMNRHSLFWKALGVLTPLGNTTGRGFLVHEVPSATGVGNARSIARIYGAVASGELKLAPATMTELTRPVQGSYDAVLSLEGALQMGFSRPWGRWSFGSDTSSFGCPGLGGSFGFADVKAQVGFGYVPNRLGTFILNDPRARALEVALYQCIGRQTAASAS